MAEWDKRHPAKLTPAEVVQETERANELLSGMVTNEDEDSAKGVTWTPQ